MSRPSRTALAALLAFAILPLLLPPPGLDAAASDVAPAQRPESAAKPSPTPDLNLDEILERAAAYCRRLESSAFDFVCREEIRETIDPSLEAGLKTQGPTIVTDPGGSAGSPNLGLGPTISMGRVRKIKRTYVYDYQCVRAGRTIREARTQLEENGKRKVVPNAELQTSVMVYANALMGPVGIFGERFRGSYDFVVAGEAKVEKTRVLVVDARPRPGAPPSRNLYGKAWIDPATGDILRIEWSESRVGHIDIFEKRGRIFERTPRLVIRSDFSAEKNGIRFPSRLVFEEAYLSEKGKAFVRSTTEVAYKDFKFFSVDYDVDK